MYLLRPETHQKSQKYISLNEIKEDIEVEKHASMSKGLFKNYEEKDKSCYQNQNLYDFPQLQKVIKIKDVGMGKFNPSYNHLNDQRSCSSIKEINIYDIQKDNKGGNERKEDDIKAKLAQLGNTINQIVGLKKLMHNNSKELLDEKKILEKLDRTVLRRVSIHTRDQRFDEFYKNFETNITSNPCYTNLNNLKLHF